MTVAAKLGAVALVVAAPFVLWKLAGREAPAAPTPSADVAASAVDTAEAPLVLDDERPPSQRAELPAPPAPDVLRPPGSPVSVEETPAVEESGKD